MTTRVNALLEVWVQGELGSVQKLELLGCSLTRKNVRASFRRRLNLKAPAQK